MKFSRRSQFVVSLALIGLVAGTAVEAADYQVYRRGDCFGTICRVDFDPVPVGKRLRVSHASCYARVTTPRSYAAGNLFAMQLLLINAGGGVGNALTLSPSRIAEYRVNSAETSTISNHISVYQAHDEVRMFADTFQRFQGYVQIGRGEFEHVACHISGDLS
jgi:hypothetical protein